MADDFYTDMRDEDLYEEAHTTQAVYVRYHSNESIFPGDGKKIPPSFDGKTSWLADEDAIDDWCDITELDDEKRGPALRNRLEGDAAIYKKILDRDALKNKDEGVLYFKRTLRPFFVKGSVNVFLYRFQQFMNLRRGSSDLMKWMSRFQIQLKRLEEAWGDTLTPISDPANDEVRQYTQSLSPEVRLPKMKTMEQKAFWMLMKIFSISIRTKRFMVPATFPRPKIKERQGKGRGGKSRGRGRGGRRFFKSRRKKKGHYQEDHSQSDDWSWQTEGAWWWQDGWSNQPDAADLWQSWDQE